MKGEEQHAHNVTKKALPPGERGMTLVEMTVAMCIFTFIVLGLCRLYGFAYNNWIDGYQEELLQQRMQSVMGYLERDIKQAQYHPSINAAIVVTTSGVNSGNEVKIYEDVDNDGELEEVRYLLDTTNNVLKRCVVEPNPDGTYNDPTSQQWFNLLSGVYAASPPFTPGQITEGHSNLKLSIRLMVQNTARPTSPLVLSTIFAIRGNSEIQEANR